LGLLCLVVSVLLKTDRTSMGQPNETRHLESRWRRIQTPIPVPASLPEIERLRRLEPRSMSELPPVLWHEAEGFLVRDPYGNQWIDLTSGIVVANAGHGHPRIVEAIRRAADAKLLVTYAYASRSRLALLEKLVQLSPIEDSKAILFSSGTEANECALALMRRHGQAVSGQKVGILSFGSGFHGRTLGSMLAAGVPQDNDWIQRAAVKHYQIPFPFCPNNPWKDGRHEPCDRACFDLCLEELRQQGVGPEHIAGILVEPMPGWATWPMPTDFAQAMLDWCRRNDILLCFDEVQSGCGRSGRFFAHEHVGVVPDLITLGKGLSSSLPVSAVLGPRWLMDQPGPGEMSSTHGGNPVCVAAALANLQVIEDEHLIAASAKTGDVVLERLKHLKREYPDLVRSVGGRGLFISVHLKQPNTLEPHSALADDIVAEAVRRGVMMFPTARGFLKIAPPLCIDPDAAIEAVDVIRDCLRDCVRQATTN